LVQSIDADGTDRGIVYSGVSQANARYRADDWSAMRRISFRARGHKNEQGKGNLSAAKRRTLAVNRPGDLCVFMSNVIQRVSGNDGSTLYMGPGPFLVIGPAVNNHVLVVLTPNGIGYTWDDVLIEVNNDDKRRIR
jgi:hypothetical protein